MRSSLVLAAALAALSGLTVILQADAGPVVAIHDSELTRALEAMPATNPGTPSGTGTTGNEWWPTNWHYFVMPESLKEALASDGTAYEVISDADISAGRLFTNGQPRYPIVISLASEAVADDEIGQFTNYVAAGGTLFVGSSSFTRQTNGVGRGDFAIANQMGLHSTTTNLQNWAANTTFFKTIDHPLIAHIPSGTLNWHMPSAAGETSWGISPSHTLLQTSLAWQVQATESTVIAQGNGRPYLAVKAYGKGTFIYDAGMQPLIAHGGYGPGMYAYGIFRSAIQAAFAASREPLARLSPWPYPYDAALNVRHDFEDYQNMINDIEASARFEFTNGVKGDYYFCTGTLREEMTNSPITIGRLRSAVTNYGATIGPHNGGLPNPNNTNLVVSDYDYWHWGPDEAMDVTPAGYASGKAYASASLSNAFLDVEGWLTGITNGLRCWTAPYFNATREDTYDIQEQLGVNVAGEQKLTPFPHWTLSTTTPGKRYSFLTLPVSDWFVGPDIGQAIEVGHTSASVHALVDYYYSLGALINLYSHSGSDGSGTSGPLVQDYITYSMTKPRLWPANAASVYAWWNSRKTVQIAPSFATSSNQTTATIAISGATDPETAVEALIPQPSFSGLQVFTNGVLASGGYRVNGQLVHVLVGTAVTNAEVKYLLTPVAQDDQFMAVSDAPLAVPAPGILANDTAGLGTNLTAALVTSPTNGSLSLSADGAFTYTPALNFNGFDSFTYRINDGIADGNTATVAIQVLPTASVLFEDDFTRDTDPGPLTPWLVHSGTWTVTGGMLEGGMNGVRTYGFAYLTNNWTNFAVEARVQFPEGAYGGGLGGRLNPLTGAHYGAWIYPENSPGGDRKLKLIKFQNWTSFQFNGSNSVAMQEVTLPSVGTNWHTLKVAFEGNQITVFYDGNQKLSVMDTEAQPLTSGGASVDMWTELSPYVMNVDDVSITAPVGEQTITFAALPNRTYGDSGFSLTASASSGLPVSFAVVSGPATIDGADLTINGAGTVVVRASQSGDASFQPAPAVDRSFIVSPAVVTVTADDKTKVYGAPLPTLTASLSGFVDGDTAAVISGTPGVTTTANPGSGVGTYNITAGLGTLSASNYVFGFANGQLTVTKAPLTVTANDAIRNYGDPDPPFSATCSGFVNGDTTGVLSGAPAFSTTAMATSPQGTYPINVTAGTLSLPNYNFTFASGILTVIRQHVLFSDNFSRTNEPGSLDPWVVQTNNWTISGGILEGGENPTASYGFAYLTNVWTNFSVQARVQFPLGAFGGGVGGRLNSATGAHYAAWVYPEGSPGGSSVLKLIKFQDWSDFGYTNMSSVAIQQAALPEVGTNWHTVQLTFDGDQISVYYDTNFLFTATDAEAEPYTNGGISLDMFTDSTPYVMNVDDVVVTEPPVEQTITFDPITDKTYGDASFTVSATASSGLPVSLSIVSGPATLFGNSVSVTGVGTVTLRASQPGSTAFNAAPDVDQSFTVNPATLTLMANNTNRVYGAANPGFTGSIVGIQNSDFIQASYSTVADESSSVGTYTILVTPNDPNGRLGNYTVLTNNGLLTVTPAGLTVTADDKSKIYGSPNPAFTGSVTGARNGDVITAGYTSIADSTSAVGTYPIIPALNDPGSKLANYSVTTNAGSLTVTPATVIVTADNKSRTYGATNPPFTATFTGFVNGDNAGVVSGAPSLTTTAQPTSGVGSYPISPSQGTLAASNYNFTFADGLLTVSPAALTGTVDNTSRPYGETNPVFTVTYSGFVNDENAGILTGTLTTSTTADTNSVVGNYPITASGQSAANYTIQYLDGTLSVIPAALSVLADNKSRAYGETNPVFTATITGFVNGEDTNVLSGALTFATSADANSLVGTYPIEVSGLSATNYSVTFSNGSLTVLPYALVVMADSQARAYGATNPALTGLVTGVQNGDNISASYSTAADTNSPVGNYDIAPQLSDPDGKLSNYSVTTNIGILHVTPAALVVTADNQSRLYGSGNPALTGTLIGVQNNDDITASYSTIADLSSSVGSYDIVPALNDSGNKLSNYSVTTNKGTLTVSAATLTIVADNQSRVYGSSNPTLTGTVTGVQNGDGITAAYATSADATSSVGSYSIIPTLNDPSSKLSNYDVTISNGTLTVTAAPLSVVADSQSRTYGATNPPFTGTLAGVVNGDNITASFSTVATVLSPVGPYAITSSLNDPDGKLINYNLGATEGTLTIAPAPLIGTADNKSRVYGETNPVFTVTYSGFVNSENASIVTGPLIVSTTADTNSPVGTYTIIASGQTAPNYTINYLDGILSVTPAPLLITADDKSRAYGQTNPVFTASFNGFVNGETTNVLDGALAFTSSADTNAPVGTYPIEVSGLSATNYSITFSNGVLTVTPYALTVVADNQTRTYGASNPELTGTLTGVQNGDGITASYSTIADQSSSVGTYAIVPALNDPNSKLTNYSITIRNGTLTVAPAALTVVADDKSRLYGSSNPTLTGTVTGVQNTDGIVASYSTIADSGSPVGSYAIVPDLSDPNSKLTNYTVTISNGTLTVTAAPLAVIADNQARTYGATDPVFTGTLTGVVNGDNITASFSTIATVLSPVGPYDITPSLSDPDSKLTNYSVSTTNGTLTVNPATLVGAADNKSRPYGETNPVFTVTYSGFVNGENAGIVTGLLVAFTTAETNSPIGNYPIAVSGQGAANYTIQYLDGVLSVTPAPLLVTADDTSRAYGQTNPVFSASFAGFVNGETANVLDGALSFATLADTNSPVGTYAINITGLSSTNYSLTFSNGILTVTPYALTLTADNQTRTYGAANPTLTGVLAGVQNEDGITASYSTVAEQSSQVGAYPIIPALNDPNGKLTNYSVTINNGTLTVTAAALTVVADDQTRVYGLSNPAFTGALTGVQDGDGITASYSTIADSASPIGAYAIIPALEDPNGKLANYSVAISNGMLTVTAASLLVGAENQARAYGATNPIFSGTLTGVVNGDNITATFSSPATVLSPVGPYDITPSLNDPDGKLTNYSVSATNGTLTVNPANLTGAADNKTRQYGETNPAFTVTYSGFVNGENASILTGVLIASSIAETNSPVGGYPITASGQSAPNYTINFVPGTLSVLPAPLLVTADDKTRAYGQINPIFSAAFSGFLNGDTTNALDGALALTTVADTNSPVGTYPIEVSGLTATNYSITFSNGLLTVMPYALTVVADNQSRSYGAPNPTLTGTLSGVQNGDDIMASYSTSADTNSPIGSYDIVASLSDPNNKLTNYSVTTSNAILTVTPATLVVIADDKSRVYGSGNPALTGTLIGVQNNDDITASYSTIADLSSSVGNYDIVPALNGSGNKLGNYSVTTNNGTLTVTAAPLSVLADNQTRIYGATNPVFTGSLTGVVNGDNITPSFSSVATVLSPVGPYDITSSLNDPDGKLINYSVSANNGTLTINPALLTGIADNKTRLYGETNPVFTVTYTGFVNSETASIMTGTLIASTTADTNSPVGNYPISVSGQTAPNYTVSYLSGTLLVTPAPLLVTAEDKSRAYGQTNPIFTATFSGFVNGDATNVLDGALIFTTAADTNSPVGAYPIEVSGLAATNYSLTFSNGLLTVTPYALTVVGDNQSRAYGSRNPGLTGTLAGVQNDDGITANYSTVADQSSSVGAYAIVPTLNDPNGKLTNYSVTISNGTLTVTTAALTVTADDKSRAYASANPTLTGAVTGVQNGDGITASYSTIADATSSVGTYTIVPALNDPNSKLTNYSVTISNGTLTINPAGSTLALVSSLNPSAEGSNVTFTATVSAISPATATPSGSVQFFANGVAFGSPAPLVDGVAALDTSNLAAGSNTIVAVYASNSNFLPSTNTLVQVVTLNLAQPITLGIMRNGDGTITVTFQGTPGGEYIVQSTANLGSPSAWSNVSTNTAGADGTWTYTDSITTHPGAFYRAMK